MGKRRPLPSSSDSEESDPIAKQKKESKSRKDSRGSAEAQKKDKKDKKDKKSKKDKEDKKSKKDKQDKQEKDDTEMCSSTAKEGKDSENDPAMNTGAQKLAVAENVKSAKGKDKKRKHEAAPPTKDVVFSGDQAFRIAAKPFGMELDGALVVDLADQEGLAMEEGVQIGWRVHSVDGRQVPQEAEGAAAKMLREAEESMAKQKPRAEVCICFITDEPEHWKTALKRLKR